MNLCIYSNNWCLSGENSHNLTDIIQAKLYLNILGALASYDLQYLVLLKKSDCHFLHIEWTTPRNTLIKAVLQTILMCQQFSVIPTEWHLLILYFWLGVTGMTHATEPGHKEIVASVVWRCVFLNVGKFDKLENETHKKKLLIPISQDRIISNKLHLTRNIK